MAQDIIAREQSVLLLQHKTHVIDGVARCEYGAHGGALGAEDLPVLDIVLPAVGLVFVDPSAEGGVVGYQIWNPPCVVAVPMCQKDVREVEVSLAEELGQVFCPDGDALACPSAFRSCLYPINQSSSLDTRLT